jgi:hypothetical protein
MLIKFKADHYRPAIERVEVLRETDCFIFIKDPLRRGEYRESKGNYYNTFDAAKAALLALAIKRRQSAVWNLEHAQAALDEVQPMLPPTEAI